MSRALPLLALPVLSLALAACADDAGPPGAGGGAGGNDASAVVWEPCPLDEGSSILDAECTSVDLPVRWDRPEGPTIPVFLQRFKAAEQPARAQLWMLQGGPGAAGNGWAGYVRTLSDVAPTIDFYIPDHRGTGRSARLGCPAPEGEGSLGGPAIVEDEWPLCIESVKAQWGDDLDGFSSEGAARDVEALIDRTREEGQGVFLYGGSYGTTWGHRFLQIFPDGADGVVLDSANWPDRTLEDYDQLWDGVAHDLFDACGADAFCSSKLGPDPWAALGALYADLSAGHCAELVSLGLGPDTLKKVIAWTVAYDFLRPAGLSLVYRAIRCAPADQDAIVHAVNFLVGPGGLLTFSDPLFSWVLNQHVVMSEVARVPTSPEAQAFASACTVCLGAGVPPAHADLWPRYDFPEAFRSWARTDTPVLFMNGGLDPFAPASRLDAAGAGDAFAAPGQHVFTFPASAHGTLFGSPTSGNLPCGLDLMLQFIADPKADLDDACLSQLAPVDFSISSDISQAIFGVPDGWE